MKKFIISFLFFIPFIALSQKSDYVYSFEKGNTFRTFPTDDVVVNFDYEKASETNLKFEFLKYCHRKEYNQKRIAYSLLGGSVLATATTLILNEKFFDSTIDHKNFLKIAGLTSAALSFTAVIILYDSNKWKLYSSCSPNFNEVNVTINFNWWD